VGLSQGKETAYVNWVERYFTTIVEEELVGRGGVLAGIKRHDFGKDPETPQPELGMPPI